MGLQREFSMGYQINGLFFSSLGELFFTQWRSCFRLAITLTTPQGSNRGVSQSTVETEYDTDHCIEKL